MNSKTYSLITGIIFAVVALGHLLRIFMTLPVTIGDWAAPMWLSWAGFIVAGALSYIGLRDGRQ
jgi:hypothetical protein